MQQQNSVMDVRILIWITLQENHYGSYHEKELLNQYHAEVYTKISPYLNEEEKQWLKEATREI